MARKLSLEENRRPYPGRASLLDFLEMGKGIKRRTENSLKFIKESSVQYSRHSKTLIPEAGLFTRCSENSVTRPPDWQDPF